MVRLNLSPDPVATTARYPIPAGSGVKRNWETQRKAGISTKTPTWHYAWPNLSRDPLNTDQYRRYTMSMDLGSSAQRLRGIPAWPEKIMKEKSCKPQAPSLTARPRDDRISYYERNNI